MRHSVSRRIDNLTRAVRPGDEDQVQLIIYKVGEPIMEQPRPKAKVVVFMPDNGREKVTENGRE